MISALETVKIPSEYSDFLNEVQLKVFGYHIIKQDSLKVGFPLNLMSGRPASSLESVPNLFAKFDGNVVVEIKYDGERSQVLII